jgi:hypothetical protein
VDAGVADQHVDTPKAATAAAIPASTCVHADADSAIRIAEFGRRSSGARLIKTSDGNFGACATEDARDFPTYAARRASNDGDLAFEIHGKFLSFVLRD